MKKNATLQSILIHQAQNAAPPSEIDLWPTIRARLIAEETPVHEKEPIMKTILSNPARIRASFIGALTLFLALALFFALPQGRAWANNVLRYFIPGSEQIRLPTPYPVNLVDLTPSVAQPTLTQEPSWSPAFVNTCGAWIAPRCSIEQIQHMVRFPVIAIAELPDGMRFVGATGGPEGVTLVYQRGDPFTALMLMQGTVPADEGMLIPVGSSAVVEEVQVKTEIGEYVSGGYFHYAGDTEAKWDPSLNIQSLRWENNGLVYTLTLTGSPDFDTQTINKTSLANLAATLIDGTNLAATPFEQDDRKSVSEVEKEANFPVIEPSWLPEGYQFKQARFLPDRKVVCLEYSHPSDQPVGNSFNPTAPSLTIVETVFTPLPNAMDLISDWLQPDQILLEESDVKVGGALYEIGHYSYGGLDAGKMCDTATYQNQVLWFQFNGVNVAILAQKEGATGSSRNWLTRQETIRLAESMTGTQTLAANQRDPEFLTSLIDIQKLASFPLRYPTKLPKGMNFLYGRVGETDAIEKVTLHYSDGNQAIQISQAKGNADSLKAVIEAHPETFQPITVHTQPAVISQGYWNETTWKDIPGGGDGSANVTWFEDGIEYSVRGFNAFPRKVWIEIAESIK